MEKRIDINIQASYYQIGNDQSPERLWIVCHGYGQLASRFIKKFESLDLNKNLILAPEGLSHFYLDGFSGNIGASWMTKHNRELEIENQFSFLETLMKEKVKALHPKRISLLGFSQGAATICRWAYCSELIFDDLYIWANVFPPDMDISFFEKTIKGKNIKIFYGDKDQFINEDHINNMKKILKSVPDLALVPYQGDHRVIPDVLLKHSE